MKKKHEKNMKKTCKKHEKNMKKKHEKKNIKKNRKFLKNCHFFFLIKLPKTAKMAQKIISFKPILFTEEDQEECGFPEQIIQNSLLNQYKILKKRMKSGNFSEKTGFLYILSKKWLKKWKDSQKNSGKLVFSTKFNEDLIDFEKAASGFESTPDFCDVFLLRDLKINVDFLLISSEIQCFFHEISPGYAIKRVICEETSHLALYPIEKQVILITDEVLKDIEFAPKFAFKRLLAQLSKDMNAEEFMRKYLFSMRKTCEKPFKISSVRMWSCSFSEESLELLLATLRESCKKCSRNYVFYMKSASFLENSDRKHLEAEDTQGFLLDIRENCGEFHLIRADSEKIERCEYCGISTISAIFCQCSDAGYCSLDCKEKDRLNHGKTCEKADSDSELENSDFSIKEASIKGLCGLKNTGNSCYFNSALQCLSNAFELTQYFLSEKFKFDLNCENKLGSQGKIARKYADFLRNLWCENKESFAPIHLKALISKRNFGEFSQEDSQEFLAFMLDMLHEDLNREAFSSNSAVFAKNGNFANFANFANCANFAKKNENLEENEAKRSWDSYKKRNNSIIVDLFTGQFKSRITCPQCEKLSITFDPFLMVPLPIPQRRRKTIALFFVRKEAQFEKEKAVFGYFPDENHRISDLKREISGYFGLECVNLELFSWNEKNLVRVSEEARVTDTLRKELKANKAVLLAFERNFREDESGILCVVFFKKVANSEGFLNSAEKVAEKVAVSLIPRILHFSRKATVRDLYEKISNYLGFFLEENKEKLKKDCNNFLNKLFNNKPVFPFKLNIFSRKAEGFPQEISCELPLNSPETLENFFSFFAKKKLENSLEIEVVWLAEALKSFAVMDSWKASIEIGAISEENEVAKKTVYDCLRWFSREERLEETNAWFCPDCKKFQRALKKFEIYKAPHLLIFQLKRFKTNKSVEKSKICDKIDFPIQDLDLTNFVLNHELPEKNLVFKEKTCILKEKIEKKPKIQENQAIFYGKSFGKTKKFVRVAEKKLEENEDNFEEDDLTMSTETTGNKEKNSAKSERDSVFLLEKAGLFYELFAVIEHKGDLGYGHYIAKCKNFYDGKWHKFDDEEVCEEAEVNLVSNNAYILFYARKKTNKF